MKIAIISDTHFGDPACTLVQENGGNFSPGSRYPDFAQAVGTNLDYLVMLGDIFDFSVASYDTAYRAGQAFFSQLLTDNITRRVIYVPGNHDADFWHTVEHEVNVLMPIRNGDAPRPFRWAVTGLIDFTAQGQAMELHMPEVGGGPGGYGGLFLDNIANGITFSFAYPNLYLKTATDTILLTHGQYFELYWNILCEVLLEIAAKELNIGLTLDLKELVSLNFPTSQFACSGIGQAGKLTDLVRAEQRRIKDRDFSSLDRYLDRLERMLDKKLDYKFIKEWLTDKLLRYAKNALSDAVKNAKSSRFDQQFANEPAVEARFKAFYNASRVTIEEMRMKHQVDIGIPGKLIFGHTHEPIPWLAPDAPKTMIGDRLVHWYNTGGWLNKTVDGQLQFVGAEVFVCDDVNGMTSIAIR